MGVGDDMNFQEEDLSGTFEEVSDEPASDSKESENDTDTRLIQSSGDFQEDSCHRTI